MVNFVLYTLHHPFHITCTEISIDYTSSIAPRVISFPFPHFPTVAWCKQVRSAQRSGRGSVAEAHLCACAITVVLTSRSLSTHTSTAHAPCGAIHRLLPLSLCAPTDIGNWTIPHEYDTNLIRESSYSYSGYRMLWYNDVKTINIRIYFNSYFINNISLNVQKFNQSS